MFWQEGLRSRKTTPASRSKAKRAPKGLRQQPRCDKGNVTNQPIYQPTSQRTNDPTNKSSNQSSNQSNNQAKSWSINQSIHQSTSVTINNQSINQPINSTQPNQPTNKTPAFQFFRFRLNKNRTQLAAVQDKARHGPRRSQVSQRPHPQ